MSPLAVVADEDVTLQDIARRMYESDTGSVIVVRTDEMVGVLTERDITRAIADGVELGSTAAADYVTPFETTAGRDTDLFVAAQAMISYRLRHIPVIEAGRVLGLVSAGDLLKELIS